MRNGESVAARSHAQPPAVVKPMRLLRLYRGAPTPSNDASTHVWCARPAINDRQRVGPAVGKEVSSRPVPLGTRPSGSRALENPGRRRHYRLAWFLRVCSHPPRPLLVALPPGRSSRSTFHEPVLGAPVTPAVGCAVECAVLCGCPVVAGGGRVGKEIRDGQKWNRYVTSGPEARAGTRMRAAG